jgi:hypothetical protein
MIGKQPIFFLVCVGVPVRMASITVAFQWSTEGRLSPCAPYAALIHRARESTSSGVYCCGGSSLTGAFVNRSSAASDTSHMVDM